MATFLGKIIRGLGNTFQGIVDAGMDSGDHITNWFKSKTASGLTEAQKAQNAFEVQQADVAYERQKEFYQQFQSPPAMMEQYKQAGLNAAVMMSGGSTGAVQPPSVPQATASSSGSQTASLSDIVSLLQFVRKSNAETKLINAEADKAAAETHKVNAETSGQEITNKFLPEQYGANIEATRNNAALALKRIDSEESQAALNRAGIPLKEAQTALTLEQAYAESIDNQTRGRLNELDVELKEKDSQLADLEMKYKEAITAHAWVDIKKINAEIAKIHDERHLIAAQITDVNEAAYSKWLDNEIKSGTISGIIGRTNYENSPNKLAEDWSYKHMSNVGRIVKDAISYVGRLASSMQYSDDLYYYHRGELPPHTTVGRTHTPHK